MSSIRARRPSPGRIDLIRLPRTPTHDINVENNNPAVRASLERHASFEDSESFTVLAQRETEAALSRHLKQEEQLARNATRERLEASCVKYDEVDVKQEALSRRQVGHPCFFGAFFNSRKGVVIFRLCLLLMHFRPYSSLPEQQALMDTSRTQASATRKVRTCCGCLRLVAI